MKFIRLSIILLILFITPNIYAIKYKDWNTMIDCNTLILESNSSIGLSDKIKNFCNQHNLRVIDIKYSVYVYNLSIIYSALIIYY